MKNFLIILFLLFTGNIFAQRNVLDYYRLLPDSLTEGYKLTYENGQWTSYSDADYDLYPVVDIKHGYIEIDDEGTGGGELIIQVALYRKKDGKSLIAVSKKIFDGVSQKGKIYFLELYSNKWVIVNDKVLPHISVEKFFNNEYSIPPSYKQKTSIVYDLPRYGTTITLNLNVEAVLSDCDDNDQQCIEFEENISTYCLKLYWDKDSGKFYMVE